MEIEAGGLRTEAVAEFDLVSTVIGLGSNLGDRAANLVGAVSKLNLRAGEIVALSSLYESAPVGGPKQDNFLNAVVVVETVLTAPQLLEIMLEIEADLGRVRRQRWGPRLVDLDIILFGNQQFSLPSLKIPHPRAHQRRFVLQPLLEVDPSVRLEADNDLLDLLDQVSDQHLWYFSDPRWDELNYPRRLHSDHSDRDLYHPVELVAEMSLAR